MFRFRGDRLVQLRIEHGESQRDLAAAIGISDAAVAHYESGRREPTGSIAIAIADHYGVSPRLLYGLNDDPTQEKVPSDGWDRVIKRALAADIEPEQIEKLIDVVSGAIKDQKKRGR